MRSIREYLRGDKIIWAILVGVLIFKILLFGWAFMRFDFPGHPHETRVSIWNRWDAHAYMTVAQHGYSADGIAPDYHAFLSHFFPLYPLAVAIASSLFATPPLLTALAISWACSIAASWLLYNLVLLDFDRRTAMLAVVFMNVYPTAYFFSAPYAESLFLLLVLASFYLARIGRTVPGTLAAAGAMLTRVFGITLIPVFAWQAWWQRHSRDYIKLLVPLGGIVLALTVYGSMNKIAYGRFDYFIREKESFNATKTLTPPFRETLTVVFHFAKDPLARAKDKAFMWSQGWNALFTLGALGITILGIKKKIPSEYTVYSLASILFFTSFSWGISNVRYTLPLFPLFIVLGRIRSNFLAGTLIIIFTAFLFHLTGIYTSGAWAF